MGKQYQTAGAEASTPELTIPAEVLVVLAGIAESAREGLLALAVGAELQVMQTLMEESVTALAGPKGRHDPDRAAVRHGHERGSVTLGGRRVAVQRPRVRAADGSGELPVAAYCSATPEMGMNGDMNLHTLRSGGAGQGLAATNAPIAKIACAASTMIVPSTLPGQTCQPRADAPLARDVRAG